MAWPILGLLGTGLRAGASRVLPGVVKRNPWKSAIGGAGAGLLGYEMLKPDAEKPQVTTGGQGINPSMDLIRGRTPMADNWTPPNNLESRLDYLQRRKNEDAAVIKKVLMQGAILKAHNPRSKDTYVKDALEFIKADALAKNNMQQARIIDAIKNKDGTLPDDSKVIYDRIVRAGGDPAYASEISGHQLQIEKTQAEAAADYMRGQPKLTDRYSKDQLMMMELKQAYDAGDQQNAINQLAYFIKAGLVKVPELYSGFEVKSDADLQTMAAQMLQGLDGTAVMTDDEIVIKD